MKRFLASFMVLVVCIGMLLTGCGKKAQELTEVVTTQQVQEQETTTSEATEAVTGWVNPESTVTVKWKVIGTPQQDMQRVLDKINEKLIAQYNLALDMEVIDWGTYNEKMNMAISAQDDFDVCFTTESWVTNFLPNVEKGAFLPLDDLIDTYAPKLRELPEALLNDAKYDGKIYAVPNYQGLVEAWGVFIQKQFVDKYNLDISSLKSLADLEPFLKQIKENEKDYYPIDKIYGSSIDLALYETIVPSAIVKTDDPTYTVLTENPLAYEDAKLANDWYLKGYIREDAYTANEEPEIVAGKYAVVTNTIKPGGDTEFSKTNGAEYVGVRFGIPFLKNGAARGTMNAISSASKHPEAAIKMIEILNTDKEIFNMLNFGIEGIDYTLVDGKVQQIPDSGYFLNQAWSFGNQFNATYMVGQEDGTWEETDKLNREALASRLSGFTVNIDELSSTIALISAAGSEYENIAYTDNFEELYKEYKEKLEKIDLESYREQVQKQLDDWLVAQGKK